MSTQKNLLSKASSIMRKNAEFISYLAPNVDLAKMPSLKKMNGGENMVKKFLKYGSENYNNLKEKTPIIGKNGAPLEFKIGGKSLMRIYKPDFSEGYAPKKGFENLFVHPSDVHHFSSGKQKLLTRKGQTLKRGGSPIAWIIAILGVLGAFAFSGSSSDPSSN
jgi:hypothetical protein